VSTLRLLLPPTSSLPTAFSGGRSGLVDPPVGVLFLFLFPSPSCFV
jgi:hypothetical protein